MMNSPTEQHLGAAFRDLVADQPFTPDVSAIEHRARQARRRDRIARGGIGAGVVAVAAVAAVGVASALPSTPGRTAQARGGHPAHTGASTSSTGSTDTQPPLVTLAAAPRPTGDATLVERETGAPGTRASTSGTCTPTTAGTSSRRPRPACRPRSRRTTTRAAASSDGRSPQRPTR